MALAKITFKGVPHSGDAIIFPWGRYIFRLKPITEFEVEIGTEEECATNLFFALIGTRKMKRLEGHVILSAENQITLELTEEEVKMIKWEREAEVVLTPIN